MILNYRWNYFSIFG